MRHLYRIPVSLDDPIRVVGLPIDEFSVVGLFLIPFVFAGMMVTSMIVSCVSWVIYKYGLKRGQPPSFLINAIYWFLPGQITKFLLNSTPNSGSRIFIS